MTRALSLLFARLTSLKAPQMISDADDTARAIMTLTLLGRTIDPTPMIEHFESPSYFRTFEGERNPSFSANCNILSSLLLMTDPKTYFNQILKATVFLCDTWDCEVVQDKWVSVKTLVCALEDEPTCNRIFLNIIPSCCWRNV